jgi:GMP synthase-like glutamine amidotransferase
MHIAILKTDAVRPEWVPQFGEYPDMFQALLQKVDPTLTFSTYDVEAGHYPPSTDSADAFLITGSKSSVYDDKAWIRDLEAYVRTLHQERRKILGICFGHQLVAKALGGEVSKSPKGWGVGVQSYELTGLDFDNQGAHFHLLASHQDQVHRVPDGASAFARNEHCEVAGMRLGNHILTFQGHPEFVPDYAKEIMQFRLEQIGAERVAQGMASLATIDHEGERIAKWMVAFLRGA